MMLEFVVDKQLITRTDSEQPSEKSKGYLQAHFSFSEDWDVVEDRTAFFQNGTQVWKADVSSGVCYVPYTVITAGHIVIWCVGYNKEDEIIITTNRASVKVLETGTFKGSIEPVSDIMSKSIDVTRKGYKVFLEIPNIYGVGILYDEATNEIKLLGKDDEVLSRIDIFTTVEKKIQDAIDSIANLYGVKLALTEDFRIVLANKEDAELSNIDIFTEVDNRIKKAIDDAFSNIKEAEEEEF